MGPRRRLTAILFLGAGLGMSGYIAAVTVAILAVQDLTGSTVQAGIPGAVAVAGSALGTNLMARSVPRFGRRPGLAAGYLAAALGSALAVMGTARGQVITLVAGMFMIGLGQASALMARYAAGDLYPARQRAFAIGMVVWAGTIGSVVGPSLLEPSARLAVASGLPDLSGGFLASVLATSLAFLLYQAALRPDPATVAHVDDAPAGLAAASVRSALGTATVRIALLALVIGQIVMVLIMTATPIHIREGGHGLGAVGWVMSGHTFGMFAFSPLTGRLVDRLRPLRMIVGGQVILVAAGLLAYLAPPHRIGVLLVALFFLGVGWNLGFVAGSALVSEGLELTVRIRLQGTVDAVIWTSSAAAGISAGVLFSVGGFGLLAISGVTLVLVAAAGSTALRRRAMATARA